MKKTVMVLAAILRMAGLAWGMDIQGLQKGPVLLVTSALQDTKPGLPVKGKAAAKRFRGLLKFAGSLIEGMRK